MAYSPGSKVVIGGQTIIDLTADTVSASKMLAGTTAHDKTGASITGTIGSQAGKTITPSRSEQVAVAKNRYTTGAVKVAAIPSTYYTMAEAIALLYPVGSVWATDDSTANPAAVLGLGTWSKVAPNEPRWDDLTSTWNTITGAMGGYYVWKRLS